MIKLFEKYKLFKVEAVCTAVCILVFNTSIFSQKVEVEKRIHRSEFPSSALQWLEAEYPALHKDRYFMEYTADTTNFEAKFCWEKVHYSIEFLSDGRLKDIEKQVKFSLIPTSPKKIMEEHFDADFKKWKVSRCQEQWVPGRIEKWYEIVVKGRDETGAVKYEYHFDESGRFLERQEIVLPSSLSNQY